MTVFGSCITVMKKIQKCLALVLAIIMCLSATPALAASNNQNTNKKEAITINGTAYEFEYSYSDGKKITNIKNVTDKTEDVLCYDVEQGVIFLNNQVLAYVEDTSEQQEETPQIVPFANYWVYHDTSTRRISWAASASFIAVASAIAAVLPSVGTVGVITAMGLSALSGLAGAATGGTVKCVTYTHVLPDGSIQCRWDWSFIAPTGETYGPYSTYDL